LRIVVVESREMQAAAAPLLPLLLWSRLQAETDAVDTDPEWSLTELAQTCLDGDYLLADRS
jgi:hypothetical protein